MSERRARDRHQQDVKAQAGLPQFLNATSFEGVLLGGPHRHPLAGRGGELADRARLQRAVRHNPRVAQAVPALGGGAVHAAKL